MKTTFSVLSLVLLGTISTPASAEPDPNFHIFLCFGQSNMESGGRMNDADRTVDERFLVMADFANEERGWEKDHWYHAVPPLAARGRGICMVDYFGRTLAAGLPDNVRVGVIKVSVPGCKIELFEKDTFHSYIENEREWMKNIVKSYGDNPYQYLVDMAKVAQQDGVIKGILLHQGESNAGDKDWPRKVKGVYDNLMRDLDLNPEEVPLLAGEMVHADQEGRCAKHNEIIATLPDVIPNAHVISSAGCPTNDRLHFNSEGSRTFGTRYGTTMLAIATGKNLTSSASSNQLAQANNSSAERRARDAANIVASPEIGDDGRVTFRLRAPEVKSTTVSGDFGDDVEMTKGTDGVWSATVGPIEPEMYVYNFIVDGVRMLDPSNPQAKIGYVASTINSLLTVPTEQPAFYDVQNVPHGEIRYHVYRSMSGEANRELSVYVPPGYDENPDKRYPVLYLLHGFANDHHSWHRYGRANEILDNLLAVDAIEPFLVAMPLGYGGVNVNGDGTGVVAEGGGRFRGNANLYERDILEDVIPLIDKKYRTIADRRHRAIFGFSMGGGQAGRIGLGNLDSFSHIGILSAGVSGDLDAEPMASLVADVDTTNEMIDLLWIACGVDDFAMDGARSFSEALTEAGIEHTFEQTPGAHHWRVWRRYLRDFSPLLFKN